MNGARFRTLQLITALLMAALLLAAAGCSAISKDKKETSSPAPPAKETAPAYHDFNDVLVPAEMQIERDDSFVYQTAGFTVGILALKGRVDLASLIEFFEKNMPRDNWQMVSQFKSPRTMMLFQKKTRWAVIEISEGNYYTYAKVWVAPTVSLPAGGLVK